jgi:hypothetical protein
MKDSQTPNEKHQSAKAVATRKKPYQKPTFRHEQVFETAALACGKVTIGRQCGFSRKTS